MVSPATNKLLWSRAWRLSIAATVTASALFIAVYLAIGFGFTKGYKEGTVNAFCSMGHPACPKPKPTSAPEAQPEERIWETAVY